MKYIFYLFFLISLTFGNSTIGTLSKVIDGDTIKFGNTTCRLAFIDTPEKRKNTRLENIVKNCSGITINSMISAGKQSTSFVKKNIFVGKQYKYDVIGKDKYNRSICNIWLDNKNTLNETIVRNGYAIPYYKYLNSYNYSSYEKSLKFAKMYNLGLFNSHKSVMSCLIKNLK